MMTIDEAKVFVRENFPGARECVQADKKGKLDGLTYIGVGLNTVLGKGKTAAAAWKDAVDNIKNRVDY